MDGIGVLRQVNGRVDVPSATHNNYLHFQQQAQLGDSNDKYKLCLSQSVFPDASYSMKNTLLDFEKKCNDITGRVKKSLPYIIIFCFGKNRSFRLCVFDYFDRLDLDRKSVYTSYVHTVLLIASDIQF